jgi:cobalt-zinc-cadmium efflux system membrane fusion protein
MNKIMIYFLILILSGSVLFGCGSKTEESSQDLNKNFSKDESGQPAAEDQGKMESGMVQLSSLKYNSLSLKVDTIPTRVLSGVVETNGQLEVPPQHEATATAILGANVTSIKVIEGDQVSNGQVLAYLSHPNLTKVQTDYVRAYSQLQYLEKELVRQKRLYEAEVGSGKDYQQIQADYRAMQGEVKGYEAQLNQLSLNVKRVQNSDIYQYVPVVSPIDGYIEKVEVQIGQYVDPQSEMFMIVNTDHIHADLMVFEKDVHKVKKGQQVSFTVESVPGNRLTANIYSIGKKFEQNPKAVHVHAEIENKEDFLIPGMYITGRIKTGDNEVKALPESAIIEEGGMPYIFVMETEGDNSSDWIFRAVEIRTGLSEDGWVEIKLLEPLPDSARVAWNNAYYLVSEMKKGSTEHGH